MQLRTIAATLLAPILLTGSVIAAEITDSDFEVTFQYGGEARRLSDTRVPLLPGNVCYTWWLRASGDPAPVKAVETLTLPTAIDWGELATNPDSTVRITEDGKVATTEMVPELDADGWFSKGWCAAEGDPLGLHRIEVSVDGAAAKVFEFDVVAPEDYAWPVVAEPDPRERSVVNSW